MQIMIISTEREAIEYCKKYRPKISLSFIRPSGRMIALWLRADNGDAELYALKPGTKRKLQTLIMIGEPSCLDRRVSEKKVMRELGMLP